jgi:hypothetical protein
MSKKKILPMARLNTRIRPDQQRFIEKESSKRKITQGELFRDIIDFFITYRKT